MSRDGDAQIHTHNEVLNRVRCDDGQWRALDGRAVYQVAAAAGAIYDRVREAALERELGVRHEQRKPDGHREIVGIDDEVCRLSSCRRAKVEGRLAEMVAAYTARHGAEPSPWAISQMSQWATLEPAPQGAGGDHRGGVGPLGEAKPHTVGPQPGRGAGPRHGQGGGETARR